MIARYLILFLFLVWGGVGCGVKGNPQPPLTPPVLGRGEINLSKPSDNLNSKKKKQPVKDSEWDEPADFEEK